MCISAFVHETNTKKGKRMQGFRKYTVQCAFVCIIMSKLFIIHHQNSGECQRRYELRHLLNT